MHVVPIFLQGIAHLFSFAALVLGIYILYTTIKNIPKHLRELGVFWCCICTVCCIIAGALYCLFGYIVGIAPFL